MQKTLVSLLLLSLAGVTASAFAAGPMRPGLWEMTVKSDEMKNLKMPKMSPEQMEQMRKMGVEIPSFSDAGITTKVCISKEMAAREQPPESQHDKSMGCESKNFQRSGNAYSVDIVCNGAQLKGEGKSKGTFSGDQSFTSVYDFKGVAQGKPVTQHHESKGKWLSADCGSIKPMDAFLDKKK